MKAAWSLAVALLVCVLVAGDAATAQSWDVPDPQTVAAAVRGERVAVPVPTTTVDLVRETVDPIAEITRLHTRFSSQLGNGRAQDLMVLQPVVPVSTRRWTIVHQLTLTVPYLPDVAVSNGTPATMTGMGDTFYRAFFIRRHGDTVWGLGPAFTFPTGGNRFLGAGKWCAGPSIACVRRRGQWVYGGLWEQQWSFAGDPRRREISFATLQPFASYSTGGGWYLISSPSFRHDWRADPGERWLIPMGGGIGRVVQVGRLHAVDVQCQAFYNVVRPPGSPTWSVVVDVDLLLFQKRQR